jgi:hypothetical protein
LFFGGTNRGSVITRVGITLEASDTTSFVRSVLFVEVFSFVVRQRDMKLGLIIRCEVSSTLLVLSLIFSSDQVHLIQTLLNNTARSIEVDRFDRILCGLAKFFIEVNPPEKDVDRCRVSFIGLAVRVSIFGRTAFQSGKGVKSCFGAVV